MNGPLDSPKSAENPVRIEARAAQRLAFYQAETGPGVLGPRGWYCFGLYGSNGSMLFVTPHPLNPENLLHQPIGMLGPMIQVSESFGGTSGRFEVARVVARIFPTQRSFAQSVIDEGLYPASNFPFGPYPTDRLVYRGDRVVEYKTPPHTEGLGSFSRLREDGDPIQGAAILLGDADHDGPLLLFLTARLPPYMSEHETLIIQQFEKAHLPSK
jgi:hypothetical protein